MELKYKLLSIFDLYLPTNIYCTKTFPSDILFVN